MDVRRGEAEDSPTVRVNKQTFLDAIICPTRGWLTRHEATDPSEGDRFRMAEGIDIGRRARNLFPSGTLVSEVGLDAAAAKTQELMADPNVPAIFEATWLVDQFVAKADILVRQPRGWKVLEVKSGINPKSEYINDVAYTLMIASRAGVKVASAALVLLNQGYRLGADESELFAEHDVSEEAFAAAQKFEADWESVPVSALAARQPPSALIFACRGCPYFRGPCFGGEGINHILDLPRLSTKGFDTLNRLNVTRISEIPPGIELTPTQERVRTAVNSGHPVVLNPDLQSFLNQATWPAFYLDFETTKSAIPLFPTVAPHEQVVTQYSVHVCTAPGDVTDHREFLADPSCDQRRELAERLLQDLEDHGSLVVYSSFEKTVLNRLAKLFPELRGRLHRCVNRLFDLEKAFRDHFYHPAFGGRTSIKATLPALVNLTYDGLEIGDGDTAMSRFAQMVRGEISGIEADATRRALLKYCEQDTLGMVLLHKVLVDHSR